MRAALVGTKRVRPLALAAVVVLVPAPPGGTSDAPASPTVVRDAALEPARAGSLASEGSGFRPHEAPFPVEVGAHTVSHAVMAVTVLPGEELPIRPRVPSLEGLSLRHDAGSVRPREGGWAWRAPSEPGIHVLRVEDGSDAFVHVNVLVLHPRSRVRDGVLNGYRIGRYQERPLRGDPAYEPPAGFVEVNPDTRDVLVSPHFTLEQFLCKQPGKPAYLALSPPLIQKLEVLLTRVNEAGYDAPTLHVMSGFRTPWYNRSIGNKTVYSRHLWGDAADVFVDTDGDGEMDDLNGDGAVDVKDGRVLYRIAEGLSRDPQAGVRPGGLGIYRRNAVRGPFIHVDARGAPARW